MSIQKIFLGIFLLAFVAFLPSQILAQEEATTSPKTTFEAFWPLTAGKTIDDPLYFLKTLKENLKGVITFGSPQKAEYAVYLGTKRVLEADKLLSEGKKDLSDKTLDRAVEQFDIAKKNIDDAKTSKKPLGSNEFSIRPRLENLVNLLMSMHSDKAAEVLQIVKNLKTSI